MYKNSSKIMFLSILSTTLSISPISFSGLFTPTEEPRTISTDSPVSLGNIFSLPSWLTPTEEPRTISIDDKTSSSAPTVAQSIVAPAKPQTTPSSATPSLLSLENSTTRSLSVVLAAGGLATLAYIAFSQGLTSSSYSKLASLIFDLEQTISAKSVLLSDQQLADIKASIQVAQSVLDQFPQDAEKLNAAYDALMLDAQKYSLV